ncbi:MAG: ShlB/FhaC/HecB family hemolysin secretion/activation protein [Candidatus Melainabacteria bacterium]
MNKRIFRLSRTLVLSAMVAMGTVPALTLSVLAQIPQAPVSSSPGAITQPESQEILPEDRQQRQKEIKEAPEAVKIDVPEEQKKPEAVSGGGVRFQVNKISVEGASLFAEEDLNQVLQKYEGQELSLDDLGRAVDEINQLYRDKGYLTSQAYIPPQDVEGGQVKIQVVEGTIGGYEVTGNKYTKTAHIVRSLNYESGEPLNIPELENMLNRINRTTEAYRLKAILRAGEETGQTDVNFVVAERNPWQISPTWDNQGRPFVGVTRFGLEVQNQNLTGIGDRLTGRFVGAEGTLLAGGSYFMPINGYGTEVGYSYNFGHVDVELGRATNQQEILGFSNNHTLTISQPLNKDRSITADASINFRRVTSELSNVTTAQDDVRSLTFGLNYNKLDRWGRSFLRLQTDIAPDWFGTNRRSFINNGATVTVGNRQFWKAGVYGNRLVRLPLNTQLLLRASAQFTPDALPAVEQFQVGGAYSVRGYSEGLMIGDTGYNLSAELRWPIPGLRYVSPWLADRIQGAAFWDMGQAFLDHSNPRYQIYGTNTSRATLLMGTGLGVRARLTRFIIGFVDFGWGLTPANEPLAQPDVRVHFGLRSDLIGQEYKQRNDVTHVVKTKN